VWMGPALALGLPAALGAFGDRLVQFLHTVASADVAPPVFGFIGLHGLGWLSRRRQWGPVDGLGPDRQALRYDVGLFLATSVPFFALMGYYAVRLTYTMVPALALLAGLALPDLPSRIRRAVVAAGSMLAGVWWLVHVLKAGPYS